MKKLVFATGNKDKMREIRMIMAGLPYEVFSMKEIGVDPEIVEDGTSFAENALIKSRTVAACIQQAIKSGAESHRRHGVTKRNFLSHGSGGWQVPDQDSG